VEGDCGWDLYLGANCHLCRAQEEREVFDLAAAFVQLQHDESWYVEDVAAFITRVGMDLDTISMMLRTPQPGSFMLPNARRTWHSRRRFSQGKRTGKRCS